MDLPLSNDRTWSVDEFDSGKALKHAARQAKQRNYDQFPIVDVDSHHVELATELVVRDSTMALEGEQAALRP